MKQVIKHKDVGLLNMISRTDPVIQKTVSLQSINYYIISTMNRKYLLVLLICVSCSIHAMAQTDYYYYRGKKIPLTLNESKVGISIPKDCDETSKRVRANVQVLATIKDEIFDIVVMEKSDFEKLTSLDFWEKDAKSVILTSCYYTENSEEVCASPYLNVKLKKKEDAELLTSYVEKFRLLNLGPFSQNLPLWFVLYVTPESEISPLVCANELYESGLFAESVADLVSLQSELTTVRGITSVKTNKSSEIYDMLGRRLSVIPQKGVYIQNGKKKLMK